MLERIAYTFAIASEAILHNRLRALLTSLGIIFGVASVIAMLAIGRGAEEEILEQIKLLGVNNVIVTPILEQEEGRVEEDENSRMAEKKPYSPGLTLADAESIALVVPGVVAVSPEAVAETVAIRAGLRRSIRLVGVDATYFDDTGFELLAGRFFTPTHLAEAARVCIIGSTVKTRFFPKENPLGKQIKVGQLWLTVIGVLAERHVTSQQLEHLGIRDFNLDVYTPIRTHLIRFEDRARLTERDIRQADQDRQRGTQTNGNYHQLDRLVVRTESSEAVNPVADVVSRMLERRHNEVVDYQVTVPEILLEQERRTQTIFNIVLAAIASISLIVGGIGIMNIMLASVMERTREIGIRRSVGATRRDVVMQFLIEATTISFSGGMLGILLGFLISAAIEQSTGILTIVTWPAVLLSFVVSVGVGLAFGFLPASRAAQHDPVVALRYE